MTNVSHSRVQGEHLVLFLGRAFCVQSVLPVFIDRRTTFLILIILNYDHVELH